MADRHPKKGLGRGSEAFPARGHAEAALVSMPVAGHGAQGFDD